MAFRGRGRGRGGFGAERRGKDVPYELYPKIDVPDLNIILSTSNAKIKEMAQRKSKLEDFWRASCYNLQEDALRARSNLGKKQKNQERKEALASYLKLIPSNFPLELIQGSKRVQQSSKKLRWDHNTGDLSLDKFEKLEEKNKDNEGKGEKKKEIEESEEEDENENEAEEESSEDDDYNQNIDFDDDEDDMNMEEAQEEDTYE
ncbi:hypothetical protein LUZ60_015409 [Juncus effusus]|nr:hypothetical protein LUZ60_015409 [Juncus effusus]